MTTVLETVDARLTLTLTGGPLRPAVLEAVNARLTLTLDGDPTRPDEDPNWWARLVDQTGAVLAVIPDAEVTAPTLTLSDIEAWSVTIPANSPAAAVIVAAGSALGRVECQLGRGSRIVAWGPVLDPGDIAADQPITVACRGAGYHLERTPVGVTEARERLDDPNWDNGLNEWSALRTTLTGTIPTIDTADPFAVISVVGHGPPNPPRWNRRMVDFRGDLLGEDDGVQIYQQIPVEAEADDMTITVRGAWYVPEGQPYRRTNVNAAIIVGLFRDPVAPEELFTPTTYRVPTWREQATELQLMDVAEWPDEPIQGRWHDIEATLTIPANSGLWLIHAAWSPPRARAFLSFPSVNFGGPIRTSGTGPDVVAQIVGYAQNRSQFGIGHEDYNIQTSVGPARPISIDRNFDEANHTSSWAGVREVCDAGMAECRWRYSQTERWLHITEARAGRRIRSAKVVDRPGIRTPNVLDVTRNVAWSRGAGIVTVQGQNGGAERNWEAQNSAGDNIEWHATDVAQADTPRWLLVEDAVEAAERAALPETLTVLWGPGSPWVTGAAEPGDTFDVDIEQHGVRFQGSAYAITVSPDPATDHATVVAWPNPDDWSVT